LFSEIGFSEYGLSYSTGSYILINDPPFGSLKAAAFGGSFFAGVNPCTSIPDKLIALAFDWTAYLISFRFEIFFYTLLLELFLSPFKFQLSLDLLLNLAAACLLGFLDELLLLAELSYS
jgi:hypothetical protein